MSWQESYSEKIQVKRKMNIEELEEMAYLMESENILEINKEVTTHLRKRGIKLREFKWKELEAS